MAERKKRKDSKVQVLIDAVQSSLMTAMNEREKPRGPVSESCDF